jgi:alanyl-tRNA synthetase
MLGRFLSEHRRIPKDEGPESDRETDAVRCEEHCLVSKLLAPKRNPGRRDTPVFQWFDRFWRIPVAGANQFVSSGVQELFTDQSNRTYRPGGKRNVPAFSPFDVIHRRFMDFGFLLTMDRSVIPQGDDSTLFICSGMQRFRSRFYEPDGGRQGSLQSCIRTDDLGLVGDGSHLTSFQMLGNFSFGGDDYEISVELWHSILSDLEVPVTDVHVHPSRGDHRRLWQKRGYTVVPDEECVWSDGRIGGHCCEVFVGNLEIGNLVNPLGHSTDVGFGWERLVQVIERKDRVDESSLFDQKHHPVVRDHCRTISSLRENGIEPGNKGRNYVCRRLLRRMLRHLTGGESFEFDEWLRQELELREKSLRQGRRLWRRHSEKPVKFWWETFGILPEEVELLR